MEQVREIECFTMAGSPVRGVSCMLSRVLRMICDTMRVVGRMLGRFMRVVSVIAGSLRVMTVAGLRHHGMSVTIRREKWFDVPFRHDLPVLARQGRSAVVSPVPSRFPAPRTTQNTSRKVSGKNAASMAIAVARSFRPGVP